MVTAICLSAAVCLCMDRGVGRGGVRGGWWGVIISETLQCICEVEKGQVWVTNRAGCSVVRNRNSSSELWNENSVKVKSSTDAVLHILSRRDFHINFRTVI